MPAWFDLDLEIARIERACYDRAVAKIAARQLGEAFVGLEPHRRAPDSPMRGDDRRDRE